MYLASRHEKSRVKTLLTFLFSFWHECGDLKWTGHNWGAEHDPDTSSCSPSAVVNNGKYLMYAYSVTGYDTNNDVSYSSARSLSDHDNTDILNSLLKILKEGVIFEAFLKLVVWLVCHEYSEYSIGVTSIKSYFGIKDTFQNSSIANTWIYIVLILLMNHISDLLIAEKNVSLHLHAQYMIYCDLGF